MKPFLNLVEKVLPESYRGTKEVVDHYGKNVKFEGLILNGMAYGKGSYLDQRKT